MNPADQVKMKVTYKRRLMATLASQGAAYGFTLTFWATGMLAATRYGQFTPLKVLLHVMGPLLMYAILVMFLYRPSERAILLSELHFTAFGFMDFLSVPAAIGSAYFIYLMVSNPIFGLPLGTFLATLVYNLLLTVQLAILVPEEVKEEQDKALVKPEEEMPDHM